MIWIYRHVPFNFNVLIKFGDLSLYGGEEAVLITIHFNVNLRMSIDNENKVTHHMPGWHVVFNQCEDQIWRNCSNHKNFTFCCNRHRYSPKSNTFILTSQTRQKWRGDIIMQKELRQNRQYIRVHKITYVFGSPSEKCQSSLIFLCKIPILCQSFVSMSKYCSSRPRGLTNFTNSDIGNIHFSCSR